MNEPATPNFISEFFQTFAFITAFSLAISSLGLIALTPASSSGTLQCFGGYVKPSQAINPTMEIANSHLVLFTNAFDEAAESPSSVAAAFTVESNIERFLRIIRKRGK
jgi:hypothetical protein